MRAIFEAGLAAARAAKIGATVWVHDHNSAQRTPDGRVIYASLWHETTITGIRRDRKVITVAYRDGMKLTLNGIGRFASTGTWLEFTRAAVDADIYIGTHRRDFVAALSVCSDIAVLKQIGALLGCGEKEAT